MHKKTLVVGASPNPDRYSYRAVEMLSGFGHPVEAIGLRSGFIGDIPIQKGQPLLSEIHTVTIYLSPENQINVYDYILNLQPKRIILNPGTENGEFMQMAGQKNIEVEVACTLVLLSTNQF